MTEGVCIKLLSKLRNSAEGHAARLGHYPEKSLVFVWVIRSQQVSSRVRTAISLFSA